jgi:hypothetical protein
MKPASIHAAYAKCCRAAITILAVLLLTPALAFFARAEKESEAPVSKRTEKDRNNNGKIDTVEETYQLANEITLKHLERLDEDTGKVEVSVTLLVLQGTPFWSEWSFPTAKKCRLSNVDVHLG